jgi:methylglutaconyl-CoA hydratase
MSDATIRIETDTRGVATLWLARPEKHNALNAAMISELAAAMQQLGSDAHVRVIILTGEGKSFCAGGDLHWMRDQFAASREERLVEARRLAMMLEVMNKLPKPLIARVQGQAFGGGIGLMSVCDVVIAAEGARFGLTETRLGLIPATISPYLVARMGEANTRSVMLSGKLFNSREAMALGLVSRIVDSSALDAAIETETESFLAASPMAVSAAKALVRSLGRSIDESAIENTIQRLADTWETPDAREGVRAFFEGRRPRFAGGRSDES